MKTIPENTSEFVRAFQNYLDQFVVIGGTPTLLYIEQRTASVPRVTKDLDIVILDIPDRIGDNDFLDHFAQYVKANEYECRALNSGKAQSYRFTNPKNTMAPRIIEISTQRQNGIPLDQPAQRLEEFDMSAIVCEPHFVELLKVRWKNRKLDDVVSVLNNFIPR